jgi:hypothetical protein
MAHAKDRGAKDKHTKRKPLASTKEKRALKRAKRGSTGQQSSIPTA